MASSPSSMVAGASARVTLVSCCFCLRNRYDSAQIIKRTSGGENVGYVHILRALCGGRNSRKSAKTPRVRPHNSKGLWVPTVVPAPALNWRFAIFSASKEDFGRSGMNPSMVLQYKLSDGIRQIAEKSICPSIARRNHRFMPNSCFASLFDTSWYSYVLKEGDNNALRGTQWVDAISVGCNLNGGRSDRVRRKI